MNVQEMANNIVWLGHDGFRVEAGKTVYFDPFKISTEIPADLILITHEHFDHCSPEDVKRIQTEQTVIVTEKDSAEKLSGEVRIMRPGDTLTVDNVRIEAVPAYNIDKDFHPKEKGWLGFIIELEGVRVYHAGDTDLIPEMENFKTDIALLPVSGTYVMTAEEAIEAAFRINPQIIIPMHYGSIVGDSRDAEKFRDALTEKYQVIIPGKA